ncbi:hypothetical protein JKP88DRAFT_225627 [Tribonema minus]|uniref:Uncharacterized protein n=1 Tax=Tribonema minus TaxID=303371 RepID=A0A835YPC0_9STRA|nr:hypothetical protein JKP88DRAFT_225627 [Tribonema minus]
MQALRLLCAALALVSTGAARRRRWEQQLVRNLANKGEDQQELRQQDHSQLFAGSYRSSGDTFALRSPDQRLELHVTALNGVAALWLKDSSGEEDAEAVHVAGVAGDTAYLQLRRYGQLVLTDALDESVAAAPQAQLYGLLSNGDVASRSRFQHARAHLTDDGDLCLRGQYAAVDIVCRRLAKKKKKKKGGKKGGAQGDTPAPTVAPTPEFSGTLTAPCCFRYASIVFSIFASSERRQHAITAVPV